MQQPQHSEDLEFSRNGFIEKNIAEHRNYNISEDDQQFICVVVGDTGTSKTSLSILLEHYIRDGDVGLDTIALNHESFIEQYTSRPREKIIIYEEGRNSFDKNKYNTKPVREARDKINQYRKFHHTLFINFQNPNHLTQEIVRNADCMLRTPAKGVVHYFNRSKVKGMWDGNTFLGWSDYDFRDFFPDPANFIPEIWQAYEDRTLDELDSRGDDSPDNEEDEKSDYLRVKQAANRLGVSSSTVRKYCDDEDNPLKAKRLPNNQRRIKETSIDKVLEEEV